MHQMEILDCQYADKNPLFVTQGMLLILIDGSYNRKDVQCKTRDVGALRTKASTQPDSSKVESQLTVQDSPRLEKLRKTDSPRSG